MRPRPTAVVTVALICACAGGPALAGVAGHTTTAIATTTTDTTTTTATVTTTTTTSTTPPPKLLVCLSSVRRVIAARLGVRAASIGSRQFLAPNGMPQCNYLIARAHRGGPLDKVVLTANVDNGPQPHWRLMRKVVEATQVFGPVPKGFRPPRRVDGLGAYASWFPALNQIMAINITDKYLMTVGVIWRRARPHEKIAITRAVTLVYRRIPRLAT